MSTFEIKMPKLGESITEGTIVSWSVKPGDKVREDDVLFEVTTEKVNAEIPSPVNGTIQKIISNEGDIIPVGEVVALIQLEESEGNDLSGDDVEKKESATKEPESKTWVSLKTESHEISEKEIPVESTEKIPDQENKEKTDNNRWYSPVVLRLAKEADLTTEELDNITGTGYLGRLSKKDIINYISQIEKKNTAAVDEEKVEPESPPQKHAEQKKAASDFIPAATLADEGIEIKDMDSIGRIIADRMVMSKKSSAHVTTIVEVDVTKLVNWRNKNKETFVKREGISLSYMPAFVEATTKALIEFPKLNSSVEGYKYILKKHINMGIAVSLDDGNLIVPVVHDTDKLSISGLALAINKLALKARANKLTLEDIQGGTFTITNFGSFRNIIGTPIINQPEVAILGVGYIEKKPAVIETPEGDVIAIRHKMYLSLSYDHRIINGALAGAFLKRIADYLENWEA